MLTLHSRQDRPRLQRAIMAVLLAHLLAVIAMAALPKWHEKAHSHAHTDSHEHEHECAVTLFLHGGYTVATAIIAIGIVGWLVANFVCPRVVWVENLFLSRSVLEHAPPTR